MEQIVSITSQGQLTIPKSIRDAFGIYDSIKALIIKEKDLIIVKPKKDFWSLSGALKSRISLSDKELKQARQSFSKQWARKK